MTKFVCKIPKGFVQCVEFTMYIFLTINTCLTYDIGVQYNEHGNTHQKAKSLFIVIRITNSSKTTLAPSDLLPVLLNKHLTSPSNVFLTCGLTFLATLHFVQIMDFYLYVYTKDHMMPT